jgi:hypothetical protein
MYNGGGGGEPPAPPQPPAPQPPPQQQAEAPAPQQTAAQQAGYFGETKESGSDPTRGEKHWDPQWEKRARKILGSDVVGGLGDLYDPEHRKQLNRMLRAAKGKGKKGKDATVPVEEAADVPEAAGGADDGGPVGQGSREQYEDITAGQQLGDLFPTRQVPGGDRPVPGGNIEKDYGQPGAGPSDQLQTGFWSPEDQARSDAADRGGASGGPTGDPYQTGLWTPEDEARQQGAGQTAGGQAEALQTGLWEGPPADPGGSNVREATQPWPPPSLQPTFYTGGM